MSIKRRREGNDRTNERTKERPKGKVRGIIEMFANTACGEQKVAHGSESGERKSAGLPYDEQIAIKNEKRGDICENT